MSFLLPRNTAASLGCSYLNSSGKSPCSRGAVCRMLHDISLWLECIFDELVFNSNRQSETSRQPKTHWVKSVARVRIVLVVAWVPWIFPSYKVEDYWYAWVDMPLLNNSLNNDEAYAYPWHHPTIPCCHRRFRNQGGKSQWGNHTHSMQVAPCRLRGLPFHLLTWIALRNSDFPTMAPEWQLWWSLRARSFPAPGTTNHFPFLFISIKQT